MASGQPHCHGGDKENCECSGQDPGIANAASIRPYGTYGAMRGHALSAAVMRAALKFMIETANRFLAHDGWAIASHIALSSLTSLFPFLIVVTALAGFFGSEELANETAKLMFLAWPRQVADPIANEVARVLTQRNHSLLTLGTLAAFYFASSGVESLRIGLNRAYGGTEMRPWYILRAQSILFILAGAVVMLIFAFLVVLGPLIWSIILRYVPTLEPFTREVTLASYAVTGCRGDRSARRRASASSGPAAAAASPRARHHPDARRCG